MYRFVDKKCLPLPYGENMARVKHVLNRQKNKEKTGENNEIRSGSPNIPNLRTFIEFIYSLNKNKSLIQVQKLCQL